MVAFVQVELQARRRDAGQSPAKVATLGPRVRLKMSVRLCGAEEMHHHLLRVSAVQLGAVSCESLKVALVDIERLRELRE